MNIILPENKNVAPVVLPCVSKHLAKTSQLSVADPVLTSEYNDGANIVREWYKPWLNLTDFKYAYFMGDGITKAIDLTRLEYANKSWSLLAGEYEWPMAFGSIKRKRSLQELADEIVYLTQPFAGSGQLLDISSIASTLVLDMAYVSTVIPQQLVIPKSTDRIFVGASKSLGVPFLRHGWMFSKKEIPALALFMQQIRYFSYFNFRAGVLLYKEVDPLEQVEQGWHYRDMIDRTNADYELQGDSWLIAYTNKPQPLHLKRGNVYRIPLGLTIQQMLL